MVSPTSIAELETKGDENLMTLISQQLQVFVHLRVLRGTFFITIVCPHYIAMNEYVDARESTHFELDEESGTERPHTDD